MPTPRRLGTNSRWSASRRGASDPAQVGGTAASAAAPRPSDRTADNRAPTRAALAPPKPVSPTARGVAPSASVLPSFAPPPPSWAHRFDLLGGLASCPPSTCNWAVAALPRPALSGTGGHARPCTPQLIGPPPASDPTPTRHGRCSLRRSPLSTVPGGRSRGRGDQPESMPCCQPDEPSDTLSASSSSRADPDQQRSWTSLRNTSPIPRHLLLRALPHHRFPKSMRALRGDRAQSSGSVPSAHRASYLAKPVTYSRTAMHARGVTSTDDDSHRRRSDHRRRCR